MFFIIQFCEEGYYLRTHDYWETISTMAFPLFLKIFFGTKRVLHLLVSPFILYLALQINFYSISCFPKGNSIKSLILFLIIICILCLITPIHFDFSTSFFISSVYLPYFASTLPQFLAKNASISARLFLFLLSDRLVLTNILLGFILEFQSDLHTINQCIILKT